LIHVLIHSRRPLTGPSVAATPAKCEVDLCELLRGVSMAAVEEGMKEEARGAKVMMSV
jgi:hypothetical protein